MAERDALRRQIELLQNLINRHKSLHGNALVPGPQDQIGFTVRPTVQSSMPSALSESRPGASAGVRAAQSAGPSSSHSGTSGPSGPSGTSGPSGPSGPSGTWRKTYSLKNNAKSNTPNTHQAAQEPSAREPSEREPSAREPSAREPSAREPSAREPSARESSVFSQKKPAPATKPAPVDSRPAPVVTKQIQTLVPKRQSSPSNQTTLKSTTASSKNKTFSVKPALNLENSSESLTSAPAERASDPEKPSSDSAAVKPTKALKKKSAPPQTAPSAGSSTALKRLKMPRTLDRTKSKFTWVRAGSKGPKGSVDVASGDSGCRPIRRTGVSTLCKASRYQWVSRVQRAGPSLKTGALSPKAATSPKGRSRFRWSAPQRSEVSPNRSEVVTRSASVATETGSAFKLRSRTKIVRRTSSSEVRTPVGPKPGLRPRSGSGRTLVSRHKLRRVSSGLTSCKVQSRPESGPQSGPAKSRTKELVSVSRHKLRWINPGLSRSQTRTSARSPETRTRNISALTHGTEFRSRFKMDKRNVTRARNLSPNLSWRNRRVQTARSFLQSRLRPLPPPSPLRHASRAPSTAHTHMCWIRGSLFRVSANRLSRAPPPRRSAGPALYSPASSASRHLARSVLQRSLSVARSSSLKHKQRQFCMFYNRFGRCNRGNDCQFRHDPDKVAVCTRFLRGRCKQGDKCTFSHTVSKDKMPVCVFFLRGVCSNAECPYSHVYVSRKARVCEDFLRGYCPHGQKCKKKHTLVCPDKNCSRGDACKLQHKRPIGNSAAKKPRPHSKRSRLQTPDPAAVNSSPQSDPGPSLTPGSSPSLIPGPGSGPSLTPGPGSGPSLTPGPGSGHGPLQKLPSFISLCSSPEESDAPPGGAVLSRGRMLQIKPRFENLNN
ncbi:uncharacterized protein zc3h3 [Eucyclogobius newberryi]|uniref:uncharacterized protein zc3h3 n=1 Tax=Eucyclogobius newberryi TaxID=166745 RepID=UPI003B5AA328